MSYNKKPKMTLFDIGGIFFADGEYNPDVHGVSACGLTPVLLNVKSSVPLGFCSDEIRIKYLTVNKRNVLKDFLNKQINRNW